MMVRCRSLSATTGSCAAHRGTPLSGAQPTAKHSAPCPVTRWQEQACPQAGSACPKREKRTRNRPRQVACLAWRRHFAVIGEVQWSKSGRGRAIFWAGHGFRNSLAFLDCFFCNFCVIFCRRPRSGHQNIPCLQPLYFNALSDCPSWYNRNLRWRCICGGAEHDIS